MVIPKLTKQQVIGSLRSTGSRDVDVLYAKKEELLAETRRMKLLGIAPIIVGAAVSITIVGAVIGIPAIIFGFAVRKTIKNNLAVAEEGYAEFLRTMNS